MLHVSTLSIKTAWLANLSYVVLGFSKRGVFNAYIRNTFHCCLIARMTKSMPFLFEIILIITNMKHVKFFIVYIVILILNICVTVLFVIHTTSDFLLGIPHRN